jgi:hypothetical protein
MEDRAMKKNNNVLKISLGMVAALGLGLVLSGCGINRAQDRAATGEAPFVDDRTAEMGQRERDLLAREQEIAEREERLLELENRIDRIEQPEPAPAPEPVEPPPAVEPEPRTVLVTLPVATALALQLDELLSSESSLVGDPVNARLVEDVIVDGFVAIPAGSDVLGVVTEVVPQRKIGGQARLAVDFDTVQLVTGEQVAIQATLLAEGKAQKKKDAATIGGAAAGGALLGRILKDDQKTEGTLLGAAVGAAIGTAVASRNAGDPVVLDAGSIADVLLSAPAEVAVLDTADSAAFATAR